MTTPQAQAARLHFRRMGPDDVAALHAHWNDPDVRRFLWDDEVVPVETVRAVLATSDASFAQAGYGLWVLLDASGALLGFCGLRRIEGSAEVEILYSVAPARWGDGLATEAAAAVLRHAFGAVGLRRVFGGIDAPNVASRRVLEKLGMRAVEPPEGAPAGVRYLAITCDATVRPDRDAG